MTNEGRVRQFFDELSRGNLDAGESLFTARPIAHPWPFGVPFAYANYRDRLATLLTPFRARATIERVESEGDVVRVRVTWEGVHQGPFQGIPPTGRTARWAEWASFRFADRAIVEVWTVNESHLIRSQLGEGVSGSASANLGNCAQTSVGLVPLPDLGAGTHRGFEGGLYPGGTNQPPPSYRQVGLAHARDVRPRDERGQPDPGGRIGLLSIGMSNTTMEYSVFQAEAERDPRKNPKVVVVDGAFGGQDAETIKAPDAGYWMAVRERLSRERLSPEQVQVIWLKEAIARPTQDFPADARLLQDDLAEILAILRQQFSKLQIVYLSSRIYAGYATVPLNPEPYAYQSGFAVRWLVAAAIERARNGQVERPWLAWGPYLWTDGTRGRRDGLIWECADSLGDGTHPSASGMRKVANLLLDFFTTDETARLWFLAPSHHSIGPLAS